MKKKGKLFYKQANFAEGWDEFEHLGLPVCTVWLIFTFLNIFLIEVTRGVVEDGNSTQAANNARPSSAEIHHPPGQIGNYSNPVTIMGPDGELFCSQYLQGSEPSHSREKDVSVENTCHFSGKKDGSFHSESGEPLRAILSDPMT